MDDGMIAASAGGWVDDALAGLDDAAVYVSPDVSGAAELRQSLEQIVPGDGSIAVAVLPREAGIDAPYATYLLDRLTSSAQYDTVVLAVGGDLQADSVAIDGAEALRIANESESAAGNDLQAGLTATVQQIGELTPSDSSSPADGGAGWVLPVAIGAVVVLAAAGVIGGVAAARRRRGSGAASGTTPTAIRELLQRLRELRIVYARRPGDGIAGETAAGIDGLAANVEQLFSRLDAKAAPDQRVRAETEYADKLGRLAAALEPDYLLDLLEHPELWDDPEQRIGEVREALSAVSTQIVDNIKQVNARRGLLFQVSLDSLVGRAELRDWEREFKRRSED